MSSSHTEDAVIFDAYAWVEYPIGGRHASTVNGYLAGSEQVYTPASVVAELRDSMMKKGISKASIDRIIHYVGGRSIVMNVDLGVADLAGQINFERKRRVKDWGMLDSFVYAAAKVREARILTGDSHFKGLPDVIFLG